MHLKADPSQYSLNSNITFILLAILTLLIYSNTFHASFQFDDMPNIVNNKRLQITDLRPASLWQTFFAKSGKDEFYRPVPSLSLALNWYVGKDNPFGYHLVNTIIHILTAFFLFLSFKALLQTPKIQHYFNQEDRFCISLLSAVLWAINPIQIQAVTYIVQRMASMAAMFSVLGIYFFLKGRLGNPYQRKIYYYTVCFISCFLAIMSKQNAVLVVPSLLLVEIIFFQGSDNVLRKIKDHFLWLSIIGMMAIMTAIAANLHGIFDFIETGYGWRHFTLVERLLTQPRIVLFYISQIFYPLPSRLSIAHDIILSTSLFSPWTTLPAILIIMLLIGISIYKMRKWPLVSFSVLFFFLNHLVESTFLPLELIFEHRNYIPSFFIFLPIAGALWSLIKGYRSRSRFMFIVLVSFVTLLVIGLGNFTYIRNHTWKTEETLWHDAAQKAPQDARPLSVLAIKIAWGANPTPKEYDVALAMLKKSIPLDKPRKGQTTSVLNNIGSIYYMRGEYQNAIDIFKGGLAMDPDFLRMRYNLISSLIMLGKFDQGNIEADKLIDNPKNYLKPDYFKLKGFILLWQDKPQDSLVFFDKALEMEPDNKAVLVNKGVALGMLGETDKAEQILKKVANMSTTDLRPFFGLIENSVRAGDLPSAERYADNVFTDFSVQAIMQKVDALTENYRTAPMAADMIMPILTKTMQQRVGDFETALSTACTEGAASVQ